MKIAKLEEEIKQLKEENPGNVSSIYVVYNNNNINVKHKIPL